MNKQAKSWQVIFYQIPVLCFFVWMLFHPVQVMHQSQNAITIWLQVLIPSLLLSMIFIRLLYAFGFFYHLAKLFHPISSRLFRIDGDAFTYVLISLFLGFPTTSMLIDEAYEQAILNEAGAKRMVLCCSCASFGFILFTIGSNLYHSSSIGIWLFLIQLFSVFTLLLFTRSIPVKSHFNFTFSSFHTTLHDTIIKCGYAIYLIGVYVLITMSMYPLVDTLLSPSFSIFPKLFMEFSSGVMLVANTQYAIPLQLCIQSAILAFAGFCVHMQVMSMISHLSISYCQYFYMRILQAILAFLFAFFIFYI